MRISMMRATVLFFLSITFTSLPILSYADLQITVSAESGYNTMDFTVSQSDRLVATVTEICTTSGYTVILQTANGTTTGLFKGANPNNSDTIVYDIKYNNTTVVMSGGAATVTDSALPTTAPGVEKELEISYSGSSSLAADTYTDTLTLTIAAE